MDGACFRGDYATKSARLNISRKEYVMNRIELYVKDPETFLKVMELISSSNLESTIYSKRGSIYEEYKDKHMIPDSCSYIELPPTRDEMRKCDTLVRPSRHFKEWLGSYNLNKDGLSRKKHIYDFLDSQVKYQGLTVLHDTVYLNNYMRSGLQIDVGCLTWVELYQAADKMLDDKI
jgi:hypothetical protein